MSPIDRETRLVAWVFSGALVASAGVATAIGLLGGETAEIVLWATCLPVMSAFYGLLTGNP